MDWRNRCAKYANEAHGIYMVNPFRMAGETPIRGRKNGKLITRRDRFLASGCDVLFMNLLQPDACTGTIIELGWFDSWQRPIFAWAQEDCKFRNHPMFDDIVTHWDKHCFDLIDLIAEFAA
jgi:nucleoside 2-deoxyribosyltransferase